MGKNWINTWGGRAFELKFPEMDDIEIGDIAVALAHLCRFTGHVNRHYSVAEHCVRVARLAWAAGETPDECLELARYGLLHDASEAYLGDVSSPLKHLPEMEGYRGLEARLQALIYRRFGLKPELPTVVAGIDSAICGWEARELQPRINVRWELGAANPEFKSIGWSADLAERMYLDMFGMLFQQVELITNAYLPVMASV